MSLTISAGQVAAFIANPTSFTGYSAGGYVKVVGAISHTQASQLNAVNATYIEASITETSITNIAAIAVDNSSRTSLNKFSFVVSDTTATAAALNSVVAKSSVAADFSKITGIIAPSDSASIKTLYAATTVGLGNETVVVTDGAVIAADLNTINAATTGKVTVAGTSPTLSGLAADVKTLVLARTADGNSNSLDIPVAIPITITDSGVVSAADVDATVNDNTFTGLVTISSNATSLSGTLAIVTSVLDDNLAGTPKVAGSTALAITLTDTNITAAQQKALDAKTTGAITATISDTDDTELNKLTGTGHALTIVANDATFTATELNAYDAVTTLPVTFGTTFATITGTATDIITALNSSGFGAYPSDLIITVNSGTTSVAQANILDAKTTGKVTATISNGDMASLNTLTGTGNDYTITVTDSTLSAAEVVALDAKTGADITINAATTLNGTLADITTILAAGGATSGIVNASENEVVNISDTVIDTTKLKVVATNDATGTSGAVNLTNVTTLKGEGGDILTTIAGTIGAGNVTGVPADVAVTISEATVDAQEVSDLIDSTSLGTTANAAEGGSTAKTTGLVTIDQTVATKLKGQLNDIQHTLKNSKVRADANDTTGVATVTVAGLDGIPITVDNNITTVAAAEALSNNYNVGAVTAAIVLTSDAEIQTFLAAGEGTVTADGANVIKTSGNAYSITVLGDSGTTFVQADVTNLLALAGKITGTITIDNGSGASPTVAATGADLATVFSNAKIAGKGASVVTVTNAAGTLVQAADLKTIDLATSKTIIVDAGAILSGTAADIHIVLDLKSGNNSTDNKIWFGNASPANPVKITGLTADHADLDAIMDNDGTPTAPLTSGTIEVIATNLTGTIDQIDALVDLDIATAKISGLVDINYTLDAATSTLAKIRVLEQINTGSATATAATLANTEGLAKFIAAGFVANTDGSARHNISFATLAGETGVTAADLKAADALTTGTINATTVTNISGKAADIISVFTSTGISNLGTAETLTITDNPTISQLNTILGYTTAPVSATVSASMADLNSLTETGNNLTISVTGDYTTAELTALSAKTIGTVTTNAGSTLTGTYATVLAAAQGANFNASTAVTVTDAVTAEQIHVLQDHATGIVTATISDTSAAVILLTNKDIQRAGAFTITVANTTAPDSANNAAQAATAAAVTATNIKAIEALTTNVLNVTSGELTTNAADAVTLLTKNVPDDSTAATISGLETIAVTISGNSSVDQINKVAGKTSGLVTATTAAAAIGTYVDATTGASLITETGNALLIKVSGNFKASEFITLDGVTTGVVDSTTGAPVITGSIAELKTLYATSDSLSTIAAGPNTFKGLGAATLETTDTGTIQASDIKILDGFTSGEVGIPITVATISGTYADIDAVIALEASNGVIDNDITDRSAVADSHDSMAITITDAVTVTEANKIVKAMTKGVVTATISDGDITTLLTTGNNTNQLGLNQVDGGASVAGQMLSVTVTDTTLTAANLKELDTRTAGTVTVGGTTNITHDFTAPTDLETVLASTGITGITTVSSTAAASVDQVNNIIAKTTAVVTATINDKTLAGLATLTGTGNALTVEVDDASADAAAINVINNKTTVAVKVDSTTITGALSDIKTLYDANTAGTVTNLGNEVVTISDAGSVAAADLHAVNTLTNGVVSANSVAVVTGSVVDLLKVYSSGNTAGVIAGLGNESVIITDTGTVAAADITTLDGLTSGSITATSVTKLTGSVTEITAARSGATVTGVTSLALTGSTETFDASSYLASNADLITAFGNSAASAVTHYLAFGVNETRSLDSFDEKSYLASHADLLTAFGSDTAKATAHYISNGYTESRALDTFDELGYVASYSDLITALGDSATAAVDHYINFGYGESRSATFDASSYLSANADLQAAFGSDLEAAKKHYINHGSSENRLLA